MYVECSEYVCYMAEKSEGNLEIFTASEQYDWNASALSILHYSHRNKGYLFDMELEYPNQNRAQFQT